MARGLSDLQQWILLKAAQVAGRSWGLRPWEIYRGYFGWPRQGWLSSYAAELVGPRYNSNRAVLSRSLSRLEARGLIARRPADQRNDVQLDLTPKGRELVSANKMYAVVPLLLADSDGPSLAELEAEITAGLGGRGR